MFHLIIFSIFVGLLLHQLWQNQATRASAGKHCAHDSIMAAAGNPIECGVCFSTYDENDRQPRTLPCGHSFCSLCIISIIKDEKLACPSCRACHFATSCQQFPVSFALLSVLETLRDLKTQDPPSTKDKGLSRKLQLILKKHENKTESMITGFKALQFQLDQYHDQLAGWKARHLNYKELLTELVEENEKVLELLEEEDTKVVEVKEEGKEDEEELIDLLHRLKDADTIQETTKASAEAEECLMKAQEWIDKHQELFPNCKTTYAIRKVYDATLAALNTVIADCDVAVEEFSITGKAKQVTGAPQPEEIDVEDIEHLQNHQVFGIHQHKGRILYSKIYSDGSKGYGVHFLPCLREQPLPSTAKVVSVNEVIKCSSSDKVFLDLSWRHEVQRVIIQLYLDTPLAQQFLTLCTGTKGQSYLNTRMLGEEEFSYYTRGCRCISRTFYGGDYEHNNGKGGAAILPCISRNHRKAKCVGDIGSLWDEQHRTEAQFHIIHQGPSEEDMGFGKVLDGFYVFGRVIRGMDFIYEAVNQHNKGRKVRVMDCGILFSPPPKIIRM